MPGIAYTQTPQKWAPAAATGVSITPSGSNWGTSAWVEITASTPEGWVLTGVALTLGDTNNVQYVVEVGVGSAGAETTVAAFGSHAGAGGDSPLLPAEIPIDLIPSGSRVAVRLRKQGTTTAVWRCAVGYLAKPLTGNVIATTTPSQVHPAAGTNATACTANASAWANGSWVQTIASTPARWVLAGIGFSGQIAAFSYSEFEIDVGVGAGGAEVVKTTFRYSGYWIDSDSGYVSLIPCLDAIPSGSRVTVRARAQVGNSTIHCRLKYHADPSGVADLLTTKPQKWAPASATAPANADAAAWAANTWLQHLAATAAPVAIVGIYARNEGGFSNLGVQVHVGIGAAGAEVPQTLNRYANQSSVDQGDHLYMPFVIALKGIPAGTRLATMGRLGGASALTNSRAIGYIEDPDFAQAHVSAKHTALPGETTNNLSFAPATGWVSTAWQQLHAGRSEEFLLTHLAWVTNQITDNTHVEIDVGTGTPGSEGVAATFRATLFGAHANCVLLPVPTLIPASTRIAARVRVQSTSGGSPLVTVGVVGVGEHIISAPVTFTLPAAGKELIIPRVRLIYEDVNGTPETHLWSPLAVGPIGAETQYTEERAIRIGELVYALSDREGRIQATSATAEIVDKLTDRADPLARTWLDRVSGKTLRGREIWIELNSDKGIYRGDAWWIAFRGFVERYSAVDQFRFRFEALGWIFKRLKEKVLDKLIGSIMPGAPVESRDRLIPLALGTLSDEPSASAPPVFVLDEAGRGGAVSPEALSSYGNIPSGTAPTGLTIVATAAAGNLMLGDQPGNKYYVQVTRIAGGIESDPDPFLPLGANFATIAANNSAIDATCNADGATAYRFYIGREYPAGTVRFSHYLQTANPVAGVRFTDFPSLASQASTPITSGGVQAINPFGYVAVLAVMADGRTALSGVGFASSAGYNRPVRFAWDPVASALSYEVYFRYHPSPAAPYERKFVVLTSHTNSNGDPYWEYDWGAAGFTFVEGAPTPIGVIPPIYCGLFTDNEGFSQWAGFLISGRPGTAFLGGVVGTERFTSAYYTTNVAAPGLGSWSTWFGPNNYVTIGGLNLYMVFLRGPLAARAVGYDPADPTITVPKERFGVNVSGVNAAGNTATPPAVSDIYDLLAILADNALLADTVNLIAAPAFVSTPPAFSDLTPRRDLNSWVQAKADAAIVIPSGNQAARWLATSQTWADLLAEWCPSAFAKIGVNPDGSMRIVVTNQFGAAVATVTELTEILRDSFGFSDTEQGYGNVQDYSFGQTYDDAGGLALSTVDQVEDLTSQTRNAEKLPAAAIAFPWRLGSGVARDLALAYLRMSAYMPRTGPIDGAIPFVHRKVGEIVQVEHREGSGAGGWLDRKVQVLGLRIAPLALRVGMTFLDLHLATSQLSLFLTEELMSTTYVGGDRHRSCVTFGAINVPINWIKFQVNWDDVPATHGIRVRVQVATTVGTIKPGVFVYPENPGANTPVVDGSTQANNDLENQEQTLIIPRASGLVNYWVLPTYASGATVDTTRMYAVREAYRV